MSKKTTMASWLLFFGAGIVFSGLNSGCANRSFNPDMYARDIQSSDPTVRIRAMIHATNAKDRQAIPLIVDRLEDEDEAVRVVAIEALKQLTGEDKGYRCYEPPHVRNQAVDRWREWMIDQRLGQDDQTTGS